MAKRFLIQERTTRLSPKQVAISLEMLQMIVSELERIHLWAGLDKSRDKMCKSLREILGDDEPEKRDY